MATAYNPQIVMNGLVFSLDAANLRSYPGTGTSWVDLSGNANNATLTNGPTFSSTNGGNITFDGTNDFGDVAHSTILDPSLSMTLSAWVNITNFVTNMSIFGKGTSIAGSGGYDFRIDSATKLNLVKYLVIDQAITISTLLSNTWYNIVAIQRSTKVDYYINSINVGSFSNSSNYQTNTSNFRICRDRADLYTPAKVSNISIYNRTLSDDEISQNFNALRGRYGI